MAAQNRVLETRLEEGVSRAELARRAGISETTLRRVEEARRNVSPLTKAKIVRGFNNLLEKSRDYTFSDLFPDDPFLPPPPPPPPSEG